jgi:integrase
MSNMSFLMLLRRMGKSDVTTHGFRSSFRDWCGELTNFPRELAEAALAHVVGDKAELAYRRGDALEKRRAMMNSWSEFCGGELASVVKS